MSLLHRHKLLTTIIGKYLVEVCVSIPLQQLEGTDSLPGSLKYCVIVGRHAIAINFGTNLIYSPVACSLPLCVLAPRTHLPSICQPAVTEPTTRKSGTLWLDYGNYRWNGMNCKWWNYKPIDIWAPTMSRHQLPFHPIPCPAREDILMQTNPHLVCKPVCSSLLIASLSLRPYLVWRWE